MLLSTEQVVHFRRSIYNYYYNNRRDFSWRNNITAYRIFVSEVMLQQTQASRVLLKFEQWIEKFPDFKSLASASQHEILLVWQGLGYNSRGLRLLQAAQIVENKFHGILPDDLDILKSLPGIGPNTAGSISAFAFNKPVSFIETNIRTVFLHEFFKKQELVRDKEILKLVEQTVDKNNPRDWYYALMDYGVYLKKKLKINNKKSKHYVQQSKFVGSRRQVRGAIVRILAKMKKLSKEDLFFLLEQELPDNNHSFENVLRDLIIEKIVFRANQYIFL
ncbi:A/G-specific adenine glycosylase [Candidatus Dependentiae bacterium]|nr:A/G-specific adenine glycosylase [Candidatus Dependentiae bacterium]